MQHFCPNCGTTLPENTRFCSRCGAKLPNGSPVDKPAAFPIQNQSHRAPQSPAAKAPTPETLEGSSNPGIAPQRPALETIADNAPVDPAPSRQPCPHCRASIPSLARCCPKCGRNIASASPTRPPKLTNPVSPPLPPEMPRHSDAKPASPAKPKQNTLGLSIAVCAVALALFAGLILFFVSRNGSRGTPQQESPSSDRSPSSGSDRRDETPQETFGPEEPKQESGRTVRSVNTVDPDCENDGSITYTYSDGSTETVTAAQDPALRATGHDFRAESVRAHNGQEHIYTCANNPAHTRTESCLWDNGTETIAPTGFTTGVLTRTCTVCGNTREETIPALTLSADTIVSISAGGWGSYALYADGTLVCSGRNQYGQCDIYGWYDITAISAGDSHIVGLKDDGTVVAAGWNDYGQCNVYNWTDIVAVSAGTYHTIGLKADGTVVAVGRNENGQCNLSSWTDIVQVWAGEHHSVGLKSDGSVVAMGNNERGQCDVFGWTDVVSISAGVEHTLAVCADGTVLATGSNKYGQCDVSGWRDVSAICAGDYFTVALRSDGTVVSTGSNEYGQCNTYSWTNVKAISCRYGQTLALLDSGSVVAIGWNDNGQCNVSGW